MLAVMAASLALFRRGHHGWAGAVLAITLQKPTLFAPLALALLAGKHWRMLRGYVAGATALALVSLWTVGIRGASR